MTIRFVQQWNGYSPDTIVTLAGAEETRLIGLGYAVTDLDGPGNTPLPVTSTTNLTGESIFSAGDKNYHAVVAVAPSGDTTGATDSDNINAAIVSASTVGGLVQLVAGTYYIDDAIIARSNVTLRGVGVQTIIKFVPIPDWTQTSTNYWGGGSQEFRFNIIYVGSQFAGNPSVSNFAAEDMYLDMQRASQPSLNDIMVNGYDYMGNCVRVSSPLGAPNLLSNLHFRRLVLANGVSHGAICTPYVRDLSFEDCEAFGSTWRGIHCHGEGSAAYDDTGSMGRITITGNKIHNNGVRVSSGGLPSGTSTGIFIVYISTVDVLVANNEIWEEPCMGMQAWGCQNGSNTTDTDPAAKLARIVNNSIRYCGQGMDIGRSLRDTVIAGNTIDNCGIPKAGMVYSTAALGVGMYINGDYVNNIAPYNLSITGNIITGCANTGVAGNGWGKGGTAPAYAAGTTYPHNAYVTSGGNTYQSLVDGNIGNTPSSSPTFWRQRSQHNSAGVFANNILSNNDVNTGILGYTSSGSQMSLEHTYHLKSIGNVYDGQGFAKAAVTALSANCLGLQFVDDDFYRDPAAAAVTVLAVPGTYLCPRRMIGNASVNSAAVDSEFIPPKYLAQQQLTVANGAISWFTDLLFGVSSVGSLRTVLLTAAGVVTNTFGMSQNGQDRQTIELINVGTNSITLSGTGMGRTVTLATQGARDRLTFVQTGGAGSGTGTWI